MTESKTFCDECSLELTDENVGGMCPSCLLKTSLELREDETKRQSNRPALDSVTQMPHKTAAKAAAADSPATAAGSKGETIRTVGDYDLISEIARGGMGVVYRARQKSLNREVALKMILAGSLASEEERIRFQTEAEAAAGLDHPGIVPIYEVGHQTTEDGTQYYYSMALIEGESLSELVARSTMSSRDAADLMLLICDAVGYAHEQGIIHRDLKPANILLDANQRPRITDFGLAKNVDGDSQLTATGQVMGTPSYMPPEQVAGKSDQIGPASDVYALGAILYCLLTGRPPFQSETLLETLTQVLDREPDPPSQQIADIDINLETICMKSLEKKPENRFVSVQDFADELQRFADGEPIHSRRMSAIERVRRWREMIRRNKNVRIQSKTKWFGLPLVSIACGEDRERGEATGTAKGIIAYGDRAIGLIAVGGVAYGGLAYGKHARGFIAVGFTSVGLIFSSGFLSVGLISIGGFALGMTSIGCVAAGHTAIGLVTVGIQAWGAFRWEFGG